MTGLFIVGGIVATAVVFGIAFAAYAYGYRRGSDEAMQIANAIRQAFEAYREKNRNILEGLQRINSLPKAETPAVVPDETTHFGSNLIPPRGEHERPLGVPPLCKACGFPLHSEGMLYVCRTPRCPRNGFAVTPKP